MTYIVNTKVNGCYIDGLTQGCNWLKHSLTQNFTSHVCHHTHNSLINWGWVFPVYHCDFMQPPYERCERNTQRVIAGFFSNPTLKFDLTFSRLDIKIVMSHHKRKTNTGPYGSNVKPQMWPPIWPWPWCRIFRVKYLTWLAVLWHPHPHP